MAHISSCRLPCSVYAVVSPPHAHSFPVARETSGVGLVPPHQPIPHAGFFVLMEVFELQNSVGGKDNGWSEEKDLFQLSPINSSGEKYNL